MHSSEPSSSTSSSSSSSPESQSSKDSLSQTAQAAPIQKPRTLPSGPSNVTHFNPHPTIPSEEKVDTEARIKKATDLDLQDDITDSDLEVMGGTVAHNASIVEADAIQGASPLSKQQQHSAQRTEERNQRNLELGQQGSISTGAHVSALSDNESASSELQPGSPNAPNTAQTLPVNENVAQPQPQAQAPQPQASIHSSTIPQPVNMAATGAVTPQTVVQQPNTQAVSNQVTNPVSGGGVQQQIPSTTASPVVQQVVPNAAPQTEIVRGVLDNGKVLGHHIPVTGAAAQQPTTATVPVQGQVPQQQQLVNASAVPQQQQQVAPVSSQAGALPTTVQPAIAGGRPLTESQLKDHQEQTFQNVTQASGSDPDGPNPGGASTQMGNQMAIDPTKDLSQQMEQQKALNNLPSTGGDEKGTTRHEINPIQQPNLGVIRSPEGIDESTYRTDDDNQKQRNQDGPFRTNGPNKNSAFQKLQALQRKNEAAAVNADDGTRAPVMNGNGALSAGSSVPATGNGLATVGGGTPVGNGSSTTEDTPAGDGFPTTNAPVANGSVTTGGASAAPTVSGSVSIMNGAVTAPASTTVPGANTTIAAQPANQTVAQPANQIMTQPANQTVAQQPQNSLVDPSAKTPSDTATSMAPSNGNTAMAPSDVAAANAADTTISRPTPANSTAPSEVPPENPAAMPPNSVISSQTSIPNSEIKDENNRIIENRRQLEEHDAEIEKTEEITHTTDVDITIEHDGDFGVQVIKKTEKGVAYPEDRPPLKHKMVGQFILTQDGLYRTRPVRNSKAGDHLVTTLFEREYTVDGCFRERALLQPDVPCMGYRTLIRVHKVEKDIGGVCKVWEIPVFSELKWLTYSTVDKLMDNICSGLINFTNCSRGDKIGIYLDTRAEWLQFAHGCWRAGLTVATCYANLGLEALQFCINQCKIKCMLIDGSTINTFEALKPKCPTLTHLIYVGELKEETSLFNLTSFHDLVGDGNENPVEPVNHTGDDLCTIMYTSGSTGKPKGVEVPHRCLTACASAISLGLHCDSNDVYLGYLPLAHILELAAENALLFRGARVGYGDPRTLVDDKAHPMGDIRAVNPTLFVGVPRVYDTIKKGLLFKVKNTGTVRRFLFKKAMAAKMRKIERGHKPNTPFWDSLVFKKLRAKIGMTRLRACASGGAPMHPETQKFIHAVLGCHVLQGYGLTETCGGGTLQSPGRLRPGEVGPPIASNEICLEDVPDMDYYVKNNQGQILIRGANVNRGYYKNPQQTREVFTEDGWFKTGDVGSFTPDRRLIIIDRIKNLVKMSHGEYVSLESLEAMYASNSSFVAPNGLAIYGNSHSRHIVGLMYPNAPVLVDWAKKRGLKYDSFNELISHPQVKFAVLDDFQSIAKKYDRKPFEHIKDIHIASAEWSPENGMLTSAMKLQRQNIYTQYRTQLDDMYSRLDD